MIPALLIPAPHSSRPSLLIIEAALTIVSLSVAWALPTIASRHFAALERFLGKLAKKRGRLGIAIAIFACVLRLALLPIIPIPQPYVHDEFSYLLAADTFASGRLTNPTHPMWQHFESFHISHVPTYMSMYFPAQGFVLAAGKVVFGHPWFGVLLSSSIFCGTLYWMLLGWLPPGWALFGATLAVFRLALFSYWVNAYHGGFVAAIAGTLVLGAWPRLKRSVEVRKLLPMALGLAILANSRPYEGLLVAGPAIAMLVWWRAKWNPVSWRIVAARMAIPSAVLILTAAGMAYYNYRVFGNALTIPYQVNRAAYASAPHFLWQTPSPVPVYRHKVMQEFYTKLELGDFNRARTPRGFVKATIAKVGISLFFVYGLALMPPLLLLPRTLRDRRVRHLAIPAILFAIGLCFNAWLFPQYLAPFIGGMYILLLQCMRHLRGYSSGGQRYGRAVVRYLAVTCLLMVGMRVLASPLGIAVERWPTSWYGSEPLGLARASVESQLERYAGKQIVLVRYSANHPTFDDWVYNAADIDRSKVVWAREMDAAQNAALLHYFSDRRAWLVEPDLPEPKAVPIASEQMTLLSSGNSGQFPRGSGVGRH